MESQRADLFRIERDFMLVVARDRRLEERLDMGRELLQQRGGISRDTQQTSSLGIDKNDAIIGVDHNHAARQGVQNALAVRLEYFCFPPGSR